MSSEKSIQTTDPAQSLSLCVTGAKGEDKAFALDRDRMVIGRESSCDIILPDMSISKKHAQIFIENGRTMIADGVDGKPSSNGVFVNDARISGRVTLKEGDVVKMGVMRFEVRRGAAAKRQMRLEDVNSAADLTFFLEYGETRKAREADILARIEELRLGADEITRVFDDALDRAMAESHLQRVGLISSLKQKALEAARRGGAPSAIEDEKRKRRAPDIDDTDKTLLDPEAAALLAGRGYRKRARLILVGVSLLAAALLAFAAIAIVFF